MGKMMKASFRMQRGKGASGAYHNDRTKTENAKHIDPTKTPNNRVYVRTDDNKLRRVEQGKGILAQEEIAYYEKTYGAERRAQQEKYLKSRHYKDAEKCTIENLYNAGKTSPDQILLQIGKKSDGITGEQLWECAKKMFAEIERHNTAKARIRIINISRHEDETTPHIHVTCTEEIYTKDGWKLNQGKCFEALGYERPDKTKKTSKKNNAKMPYTEEMRQKWYDIIEQTLDVTIDRVPDKEKKYQELDHEIGKKEQKLAEQDERIGQKAQELKDLEKAAKEQERVIGTRAQLEEKIKRMEKLVQRATENADRFAQEQPENIIGIKMLRRDERDLKGALKELKEAFDDLDDDWER